MALHELLRNCCIWAGGERQLCSVYSNTEQKVFCSREARGPASVLKSLAHRPRRERGLTASMQVVRHERASVKADMWSYGILVWELISNQDITNLQPLAIAQAMQVNRCCI